MRLGQLGRHHQNGEARHLDIAETILAAVEARDEMPSVQAINQSVESLAEVGFVAPLGKSWPNAEDADPNQPRAGWQASHGGVQFPGGVEADLCPMSKVPFSSPKEGHWHSAPFVS